MNFALRTFNSIFNNLQAKGKIPNIKVSKINKIVGNLDKKLNQGEKISENLAGEFDLSPEDMNLILKAYRNKIVNQKLSEIMNGGNVDLYELSEQLDISYPELAEKLLKLRGGQNIVPENEEEKTETEPETEEEAATAEDQNEGNNQNEATNPETIQEETNHEAERILENEEEEYEELIIEQNDEDVEEPIAAAEQQTPAQPQPKPPAQEPLPVQEPEYATINNAANLTPQALIENYAALIIQNPASRYENIQQQLDVPVATLIRAEQVLAEQNSIAECRNRVLELIRTTPGIDDPELMRRTGLTLLQIHLVVRPLLLSTELHSGRPN
jgi:cobalamin biosynthesis protein CobT